MKETSSLSNWVSVCVCERVQVDTTNHKNHSTELLVIRHDQNPRLIQGTEGQVEGEVWITVIPHEETESFVYIFYLGTMRLSCIIRKVLSSW